MIELPVQLPLDTKEKIVSSYHEILADLDASPDGEAGQSSPVIKGCDTGGRGLSATVEEVCRELRDGGKRWQKASADLAALFVEIVEHGRFRNKTVSGHAGNCAKAALEYLVKEFDVIPDYDPVMGFVDDALVLNLALSELRDDDQKLYDLIEAELK